jgi:16S rRNA processing protein RimM
VLNSGHERAATTTRQRTETGLDLLAVGEVLRPYGLAGELRVRPLTDRPEQRFGVLERCALWEADEGRCEWRRVASRRFDGTDVLVRLEGIDSPEAAGRLRGWLIAVDRAEALPPPPGHFYPWQLVGAQVKTGEGRTIGTFRGVESGAAQALWVIGDGDREWLVPAVPEIVRDVNVAEQLIVIDPPEGLLDL